MNTDVDDSEDEIPLAKIAKLNINYPTEPQSKDQFEFDESQQQQEVQEVMNNTSGSGMY